MTKICLIGNSHLGAVKRGCDADALAKRGITPVFFGSIRDSLRFVEVKDGIITPNVDRVRESFARTSGGIEVIDPSQYDAFVLVGLSISMKRVNRFYRFFRWHGQQQRGDTQLVRRTVALEALTNEFSQTRMAVLARLLRTLTDKPIFGFAEPFWGESVLDAKKEGTWWRLTERSGDADGLRALFTESIERALSGSARFIPQPDETVARGIFTQDRFNRADPVDGVEFGIPPETEEGGDFAHMNAAFGHAFWEVFLPLLPVAEPVAKAKPKTTRAKKVVAA